MFRSRIKVQAFLEGKVEDKVEWKPPGRREVPGDKMAMSDEGLPVSDGPQRGEVLESQNAKIQIKGERQRAGQWEYKVWRSRGKACGAAEAWEAEASLWQHSDLIHKFLCATYVGRKVAKDFPQYGVFEGKATRDLISTLAL